jgi:hypothetical protein
MHATAPRTQGESTVKKHGASMAHRTNTSNKLNGCDYKTDVVAETSSRKLKANGVDEDKRAVSTIDSFSPGKNWLAFSLKLRQMSPIQNKTHLEYRYRTYDCIRNRHTCRARQLFATDDIHLR